MKKLSFIKKMIMMITAIILVVVVSCDENELPGVGDVPDENPPVAGFAALVSGESYLQYSIVNSSSSATTYQWTVPDDVLLLPDSIGAPTREELLKMQNLVAVFPGVNSYEFTLSVSDNNGITDAITQMVAVVEQEADPANPDFEIVNDGSDPLVRFLNSSSLSSNTSTVKWVLPDGVSYVQGDEATDNITVQFEALGTYTISLIGYNFIGESTTIDKEVVVAGFVTDPVIVNPSWEKQEDGSGSAGDGWDNDDLGKKIGSSSSNPKTGTYSFKADKGQARMAYQEIEVVPNNNYVVKFFYAMKNKSDNTGRLEFRVLNGGGYDTIADVENPDKNTTPVTYWESEASSSSTYNSVGEGIQFNSGDNTTVSLFLRGVLKEGGPGEWTDTDNNITYPYISGNEDIRVDDISVEVVN